VIGYLRRNFLTGLLALAPLAITAWVSWRFYAFISATMRPWVRKVPTLHEAYPEFFLTLIGVAIFILLITLAGAFTRNLMGIAFFRLVERVVERIPVIKSMYSGTKQIATVFLQDRRTAFKHVAVFEYPRPGLYALGFVTSEGLAGDLASVFLPTTPNPTSGFMLLVPRRELRVVDLPVEEAIKLIVAGGAIMDAEQAAHLAAEITALAQTSATDGKEEDS